MQSVADALPGQVTFSGRLKRFLAYFLSPKVLIGGVLAYALTQGVEAYKIYRTDSREDIVEVRKQVLEIMLPSPQTAAAAQLAIDDITRLFALYRTEAANDVLVRAVGTLAELKAALAEKEAARVAAIEAERQAQAAIAEANGAAAEAQAAEAKAEEVKTAKRAVRVQQDAIKKVLGRLRF